MRRVTALVFDGMKMLDLAGPFEVFAEAAKFGASYSLEVRSASGEPFVVSSNGLHVSVDGPASAMPAGGTVLLVGGDALPTSPLPSSLVDAAIVMSGRAGRTASICTGAFILAAAGLLDGRRATTHWQHAGLLAAAYPEISVESDSIFVSDGPFLTSAGVSAGIDLALHLVEQDYGPEIARSVARSLVVFLQRPGGQSQFSPSLARPRPAAPALRTLTEAVAVDPAADHSVPALAARAHVSPRHLARLFRRELRTTPSAYVESVRLDAAVRMLHEGHSVAVTAQRSGLGSPETLRRLFVARFGVSPRAYQQRFRSSTS